MPDKHKIKELQNQIDLIDNDIISNLVKRKSIANQILSLKKELALPYYNPVREEEITNRLNILFKGKIEKKFINKIYQVIFKDSIKNHLLDSQFEIKNVWQSIESNPIIIAGPCAVESKKQINKIASEISKYGIKLLRGGAFKPRTSPDSFQGLGDKGIEYMRNAADNNNMFVVTEICDSSQLDKFADQIDVIQIGSRSMTAYGLLKKVGEKTASTKKPVLLKRGFNATLNEFLLASKYITDAGNPNVLLCLRGIRTFEQIDSKMRFTPDLSSILELKDMTDLKVIFDPSHSTGNAKYVKSVSKVALELGADGLMIETHYSPKDALSDSKQAILPKEILEIID